MNPQDAIDLGRESIRACLMIGGPILVASLLIGLLIGVFQAMTQVQDQTVAFVPKILSLIILVGLCLPWLSDRMVAYSEETLTKPMTHFRQNAPMSQVEFLRSADRSLFELPHETRRSIRSEDKPKADEDEIKSPFILPHYRYSRIPKTNLDG
jgi:flagellar biosynthetic protein FliQ